MYGWAPLALLGEEINKLGPSSNGRLEATATELNRLSNDSDRQSHSLLVDSTAQRISEADVYHQTGVYLGIWNIYATIPQFIASFIALVAFSTLEPGRSLKWAQEPNEVEDGPSSKGISHGISGTAACLVVGALCSFVAAILTFQLRKRVD